MYLYVKMQKRVSATKLDRLPDLGVEKKMPPDGEVSTYLREESPTFGFHPSQTLPSTDL